MIVDGAFESGDEETRKKPKVIYKYYSFLTIKKYSLIPLCAPILFDMFWVQCFHHDFRDSTPEYILRQYKYSFYIFKLLNETIF